MIPRGPSGPVWSGTQRPDSKTGYPFASPSRRRSSFRIFPFIFPSSSSIDDYRFPLSLSLARPMIRSFSSTCFKEAFLEGLRGACILARPWERPRALSSRSEKLVVGQLTVDECLNPLPAPSTALNVPSGIILPARNKRPGRDRRR